MRVRPVFFFAALELLLAVGCGPIGNSGTSSSSGNASPSNGDGASGGTSGTTTRDPSLPTADGGGGGSAEPIPSGSTPIAHHGALSVSGNAIVGAKGAVALRGMSFYWSQWSSDFWNKSAVDVLVDDWKVTVVRAAMGVENGGYLENQAREKARVRTIVDAAIARGVYVIIDWHDHYANNHTEDAKAFFREMADAYGTSPNVLFEIWNEPLDVSWSTVKEYANAVIPEIRGRGANNVVIVGTPHWSQDVDAAAQDPVAQTNVAYAIHFYANTYAHREPLRQKAITAMSKGLALFATEWGTPSADGSGTVNTAESQTWLEFLKAHNIGWCNWSLVDKAEAAAALTPGASPTGPWADDILTPSGRFVKQALAKP